jgi:hypothetical protein
VVYSNDLIDYDKTKNGESNEKLQKFQELTGLTSSLNAFWSAFLGDYGSLPESDTYIDIAKVAYAIFITVIILNLMSMYCHFCICIFFSSLFSNILFLFDSCTCK